MPRYFFDVRDGDELFVDEDGIELSDMQTAIREARRALADMVRDNFRSERPETLSVSIRDGAEGPVILSVTLQTIHPGKTG